MKVSDQNFDPWSHVLILGLAKHRVTDKFEESQIKHICYTGCGILQEITGGSRDRGQYHWGRNVRGYHRITKRLTKDGEIQGCCRPC